MKTDVEPESKPAGKKTPGIQAPIDDALSFTWTDIKITCSLLLVAYWHVDKNIFSQTPSSQLDCLTNLFSNFEREIHRHRIHYDCPFYSQQNFGPIYCTDSHYFFLRIFSANLFSHCQVDVALFFSSCSN